MCLESPSRFDSYSKSCNQRNNADAAVSVFCESSLAKRQLTCKFTPILVVALTESVSPV
jgi:hypothetical protein